MTENIANLGRDTAFHRVWAGARKPDLGTILTAQQYPGGPVEVRVKSGKRGKFQTELWSGDVKVERGWP